MGSTVVRRAVQARDAGTRARIAVISGNEVIGAAVAACLTSTGFDAFGAGTAAGSAAVEDGSVSAVVLVPGPGVDPAVVASAVLARPDITFIVTVAPSTDGTPPPLGAVQPVMVTSLDSLIRMLQERLSAPYELLTPRHVEILQQLADGATPAEAAQQLGIAEKTFNNHLGAIYRRMDVPNVTQAVLMGIRRGVISVSD